VIGNSFTSCARSGIAYQRNVHDLKIIGNQFTQASDQDIDGEPSGSGVEDGLEIIGNTFADDTSVSQGDWAVTVTGLSPPHTHVVVTGNNFKGRGINLYRTSDAVIANNVFDGQMKTGYGVINIENVANVINISGNTIRRKGFDGAFVRISHHSGGFATDVNINNNEMVNETGGGGIVME